MTVPPIGNLLAIFEQQIYKNEQDIVASNFAQEQKSSQPSESDEYLKHAVAGSITRATDEIRNRQIAKRQGLAKSIREKVKLFDEGKVTIARKPSRELDYNPDQVEFDPAKSKTVFERRSSVGPGIEYLHRTSPRQRNWSNERTSILKSLASTPPPTASLSSDDDCTNKDKFSQVPSSPNIHKRKISNRRASTGVIPSHDQRDNIKHRHHKSKSSSSNSNTVNESKSPKRKKKKRVKGEKSASVGYSSSEGETILDSPKRSRKAISSPSSPKKSPSKSPSKGKTSGKSSKKSSSKSPSSSAGVGGLPKVPSLEKSGKKTRRGKKKEKKSKSSSTSRKKRSSKNSSKKSSKWEEIVTEHEKYRQALFGGLHRSASMVLPRIEPLTPQRRLARRASTGRLANLNNSTWALNVTHAVQIELDSDDTTSSTTQEDEDPVVKEVASKAEYQGRPAPRRRMVRRHSTGSVSTRSNESEEQLMDFWHTYESDDSMASTDSSTNDSVLNFRRRRTVRFDKNVTVWVFTKEDTPYKSDLELPQSFVPSPHPTSVDSAPRPPVRRTNSIEADPPSKPTRDLAPAAPSRRNSADYLEDSKSKKPCNDADDDDANSIDSWPRMGKYSRQTQERRVKKKHSRRVRFAEELEEVRFYEKDNTPEVVLPQVGIVFCAEATEARDDNAPQAPRRNNSNAGELMASIRDSIQALRETEAYLRKTREIDLKPRRPVRTNSTLSIRSEISDESTISLQGDDDDMSIDELTDEEENDQCPQVSFLRPGSVRGDSILGLGGVEDVVSEENPRIDHSLRPGRDRGNSIRSIAPKDEPAGQLQSSVVASPMLSSRSLRPGSIRGNSINRLRDDLPVPSSEHTKTSSIRSIENTEISLSHGAGAQSLRPSTIRGDSYLKCSLNDAPVAVTPCASKEIIWEGSAETNHVDFMSTVSPHKGSDSCDILGADFNPQAPPCLQQEIMWEGTIPEVDTEDNTECSEDPTPASLRDQVGMGSDSRALAKQQLPSFARRPDYFRGESVRSADDTAAEIKKSTKRPLFGRLRRGVKPSQSNDEISGRSSIFDKVSIRRGKIRRRISGEI